MRRLLLVRPVASGGLDAHADHEQALLSAAGWEVSDAGLRVSSRPSPGADLRAVRILRLAASRADAVHAHGLRAGALASLALGSRPHRAKLVVTVHNMPIGSAATRAIGWGLLRILARRADLVLGVSPDLVDAARRAGARHVEPALVPAPRNLAPEGEAGTEPEVIRPFRTERTVAGQEPLQLLTVARLAPQKGLEDLLDAMVILRQQRVPTALSIAGEGPLRRRLALRIADEALPVTLLGRCEDVPALLTQADVVVSAARWEGQPLGMQEALAAGRPIIATDAGGTRWITGEAAALVPVGDPSALARQIVGHRDQAVRQRAADASRAQAMRLPGAAELTEHLERALEW